MYVRVKQIGSKRYAYLAEGRSENGKVRQKVLAYLGPLTKMARGVPDTVMRRVDGRLGQVEWDRINVSIRDIPLTFEEWQEVKKDMLPRVLSKREDRAREKGRGSRPRIEGELAALTLIARKRFSEMFETLKDGTLVMR
jgi:hypothetical protein